MFLSPEKSDVDGWTRNGYGMACIVTLVVGRVAGYHTTNCLALLTREGSPISYRVAFCGDMINSKPGNNNGNSAPRDVDVIDRPGGLNLLYLSELHRRNSLPLPGSGLRG